MAKRKKPDWPTLSTERRLYAGIDASPSPAARSLHQQLKNWDLIDAADRLEAARARLQEALGARLLVQRSASDALAAARADRRARTKSRRNIAAGGF